MTDRRSVLKAGLAGSVLPLGALAATARAAEPLQLHRAVYDSRFAAGRAFAAEARAKGWTAVAIEGDVTDLWCRHLDPRWRQGPAPVAGVTAANSLFVLERLAWDAGMRVVSRAPLPHEPVVAWLIAPQGRAVAA
jgi:hypothetical protein